MRRDTTFISGLRRGLLICSLVLMLPLTLRAQETAQQPESPTQGGEEAEPTGKASPHYMGHMRERHEQMAAMHKEMDAELQRQMTALRAHAQTMSSITDTQQLVVEMKKHQQLSDELLNTLIEQRHRMHAGMYEHHEHGHQHQGHQEKPGCCAMMEHKDSPVSPQ
jgi:hypothetical protein